MARKVVKDEDFESDYDLIDDGIAVIEMDEIISTINLDARRRLEIIMENKELERMSDGGFNYYF